MDTKNGRDIVYYRVVRPAIHIKKDFEVRYSDHGVYLTEGRKIMTQRKSGSNWRPYNNVLHRISYILLSILSYSISFNIVVSNLFKKWITVEMSSRTYDLDVEGIRGI
jgi:hypothetical protein